MLSPQAEKIIERYFNLPFPGVPEVRCPYYINSRKNSRAQLRVLSGKGSPEEIVEEAKIISIQYHLGLFDNDGNCTTKDTEQIRKFLVEQNLGIECSGFVSHILKSHYLETKQTNITSKLSICPPDKFLRQIICKLRPIENMDVKVFADDRNSEIVDTKNGFKKIAAADYFVIMEAGPLKKRNHIILFTANDNNVIEYVHSRSWSSDGRYGHGVSRGKIEVIDNNKGILEQKWTEDGKVNEENETWRECKSASKTDIRRLKI